MKDTIAYFFLIAGASVALIAILVMIFAPIAHGEIVAYIIFGFFAFFGLFFVGLGLIELGVFDKKKEEKEEAV